MVFFLFFLFFFFCFERALNYLHSRLIPRNRCGVIVLSWKPAAAGRVVYAKILIFIEQTYNLRPIDCFPTLLCENSPRPFVRWTRPGRNRKISFAPRRVFSQSTPSIHSHCQTRQSSQQLIFSRALLPLLPCPFYHSSKQGENPEDGRFIDIATPFHLPFALPKPGSFPRSLSVSVACSSVTSVRFSAPRFFSWRSAFVAFRSSR